MKKLLIRLLTPPFIVLLAVLAFKSGVVVQEKPELTEMPAAIILFHCISLFGFGAKDLGFPIEGPLHWQYILVSLYFVAPMVTFVAATEILYFLTKSFLPLLLFRGGHYLILGYGRKGSSVVNAILKHRNNGSNSDNVDTNSRKIIIKNKVKLVIVDEIMKDVDTVFNIFNLNRIKFHADLSDTSILSEFNIRKCKGIFIVTNNEWLNLKLYFKVAEILKPFHDIKRPIIYTAVNSSEIISTFKAHNIDNYATDKFFNVHVEASKQLFDHQHINKIVKAEYDTFNTWKDISFDNIIFVGFGRFSRSFYFNLIRNGLFIHTAKQFLIFDRHPEDSWQQMCIDYRLTSTVEPKLIQCEIEHLSKNQRNIINKLDGNTLVLFGVNDETLNLKTATFFHKNFNDQTQCKYILRMSYRDCYPANFVNSLFGNETIIIPTYEWIEAYFEDEFTKKQCIV